MPPPIAAELTEKDSVTVPFGFSVIEALFERPAYVAVIVTVCVEVTPYVLMLKHTDPWRLGPVALA